MGKLCTQSTHKKRLKIVEHVFLRVLQHPTKCQVEILRGTKVTEVSLIN